MDSPTPPPALVKSFNIQAESLLIETQNFELDPPYEMASYNLRLLLEERVWHIDEYASALKSPSLTMKECASVVRSCVTGRVKVNTLTMGNVDEGEVRRIMEGVRDDVLGDQEGKPELNDNELPQFRSMQGEMDLRHF